MSVLRHKSPASQRGLTLIELLVAMGLGAFILTGIVQVFLGSRQSFDVIRAQSSMQESARFAMSFISDATMQAGYINAGDIEEGDYFASELVKVFRGDIERWDATAGFDSMAVVAGMDDFTGNVGGIAVKGDTDVLLLRQQGDPDLEMFDCAGAQLTEVETSFVQTTFFVGEDDQLYCDIATDGVSTGPVALVTGIENMQLQFGIGGAAGDRFRAAKYVSATDAVDEWVNTMTVRVGLLAISDNEPLQDGTVDFELLDKTVTGGNDGRSRRVFTRTITLRSNISDT